MDFHENWSSFMEEEIKKKYYLDIQYFLKNEIKKGKIIFPQYKDLFNFLSIDPQKIKVIIIGQDPYHGENQAHGYAFSVKKGVKIPPSLKNIYKEIESEFDFKMSKKNGDLSYWVNQGVMLINTTLTVEKGLPGSHKNIGWQIFTDNIIKYLSDNYNKKVFMLWGNHAIKKKEIINHEKHLILSSAHPSPLSAHNGFIGNKHFKKANDFLFKNNMLEIDWEIKD